MDKRFVDLRVGLKAPLPDIPVDFSSNEAALLQGTVTDGNAHSGAGKRKPCEAQCEARKLSSGTGGWHQMASIVSPGQQGPAARTML